MLIFTAFSYHCFLVSLNSSLIFFPFVCEIFEMTLILLTKNLHVVKTTSNNFTQEQQNKTFLNVVLTLS